MLSHRILTAARDADQFSCVVHHTRQFKVCSSHGIGQMPRASDFSVFHCVCVDFCEKRVCSLFEYLCA